MYRPDTNLRQRPTTAAALIALLVVSVAACGSDDASGSDVSSPPSATAETAASPTEPPSVTEPAPVESAPATEPAETVGSAPAPDEAALAQAALLQPADVGDGWQDYGPESAFPMTAELALSIPSCAPYVDVVFDGNTGVWASTTLGRNEGVAFTSVTVFPSEAEAAAMVAATATPEFDQCWADFNEVAVVAMPFGIDAASYESVEPPDVELAGDSSSLHALEGTFTLGSTSIPDSCVCAFVQQGRTVVTFHSAAPIFSCCGPSRRDRLGTGSSRRDRCLTHGPQDELLPLPDPPACHERHDELGRES